MRSATKFLLIFCGVILLLGGYFIYTIGQMSPGTHGSIEAYKYPVSKLELEKAVNIVLKNTDNVKRDTIDNSITKVNSKGDSIGKIRDNHYNDGKRYLTVFINFHGEVCQYTFQYTGTDAEWDSSKDSEISIAYAWDGGNRGGNEGHNDFNGKSDLKKKLTDIFESEFLEKVNKQLGKKYVIAH